MTGIDKIAAEIEESGRAAAAEALANARREAEAFSASEAARGEAERTAAAQDTDARCRSIAERAASGAALRERRAVLAEKQRLLGETLERARQAALALPDDDYFALLLRMAKRYALGKSGEAAFSARDQKRMPKDFPAKLDAAAKELGGSLTVSKESCFTAGWRKTVRSRPCLTQTARTSSTRRGPLSSGRADAWRRRILPTPSRASAARS